jgi:hypothetical protein
VPVTETVDAFITSLDHPYEREIRAVREIILGADAGIAEGIKWNAPSFRTREWFATFHLRAKGGVQVILHRGAKRRTDAAAGIPAAGPGSLIEWLGADRASARFRDLDDIAAKRAAFARLVREWIPHV